MAQNRGQWDDDSCYWRNEPAQPVSHRPPLRMRIIVCHYPEMHTWHTIVAEPTCHLPQARKYWRFSYEGDFTEFAERVECTNIGSRQGSAAWEGKRAVLQEVRARLAALDNTVKGRSYRWHRPGHGKTWRPQVTTPRGLDTPSQRTLRLDSKRSPGAWDSAPSGAASQTRPRMGGQRCP